MSVTQHDAMERSIIRKADAAQSETPPRECKMTSDENPVGTVPGVSLTRYRGVEPTPPTQPY